MFKSSRCSVQEASAGHASANFQLAPAADGRQRLYIYNGATVTLFIKIGSQSGVDANFQGFPILAGGVYESPGPISVEVNGIFASADGGKYASVTEVF